MERWLVINEFFIIFYYSFQHIKNEFSNITNIVLFLLIYLSLKLTYYIFNNNKIRKYLLLIIISYISLIYFYFDKSFILFLPLNIYFIYHYLQIEKEVSIISIIAISLLIDNFIVDEFILISGVNYLLYNLFLKSHYKISKLTLENDILRDKNFNLNNYVDRDKNYEEEMKYLSKLEERNKISQEIHDNIGHTISGSIMQLEAAKLLINKNIKRSEEMIDNTISVLRKGMEETRITLRELKPASEELGIHKLNLLIKKFEKSTNIKVNLLYDQNIDKITYIQWNVILNNTREAITNTIKYSKASKINIKIEVLNKIIKIEIKDNGIGKLNIKKGLGIKGMEERTENIDGNIIIDGSDGFSVIMLLPIKT